MTNASEQHSETVVVLSDLSMRDFIDMYDNGLISLSELIVAIEACGKQRMVPIPLPHLTVADPELLGVFTEHGIKAILARVNGIRELNQTLISTNWTVTETGSHLIGHALLEGHDDADPRDYEWIMPEIRFPLPPNSLISHRLAEHHQRLTVRTDQLMFARR